MSYPEIPTSPILENSKYNTTYSYTFTFPSLSFTQSTPSNDSNFTSFSTSSYITTTLFPEIITENIFNITAPSSPTAIITDPVNLSIRKEILEAKEKLSCGYFTASIYVLLKIIERKENNDVAKLVVGLLAKVTRLNSHHRLAMFGPIVNSVFTSMVEVMVTVPAGDIQLQAENGIQLIENRKVAFQPDTKAVFDVVDAIYMEEEYNEVAEALTDIQKFPNISTLAIDVAEKAITAFIFNPYMRIEGSAKEKLLLMEINYVVKNRMFTEENKMSRLIRRNFRKNNEFTTEMAASTESITIFKGTAFTKSEKRNALRTQISTTVNSSETDYTSYLTDPKIMKRLRHRMKIYKEKFRKIKKKERKMKTKRGPTTTTTTTTTTTEMPPMHKSKYYMRKYVKKNLYKMKTTTIKTSRFTWRYYGKIRKFNDYDNFKTKIDSSTNDSSDSEGYYSDSDEDSSESDENKSNVVTMSMASNKLKSVNRFHTNKKHTFMKTIADSVLFKNKYSNDRSALKKKNINKIQRYLKKADSSDSNAEVYLQVNLNDALLHKNDITIGRRFLTKKVNKLRKMDSFSDDEAILKSNIYKVFGYSKDFAKQLRAML